MAILRMLGMVRWWTVAAQFLLAIVVIAINGYDESLTSWAYPAGFRQDPLNRGMTAVKKGERYHEATRLVATDPTSSLSELRCNRSSVAVSFSTSSSL